MPAVKSPKKSGKKNGGKAPAKKNAPAKEYRGKPRPGKPKAQANGKLKPKSNEFWSIRELAEEQGVSTKTVYEWILSKKIVARQAGDKDKLSGFIKGEWMIQKKGFKRPPGLIRVG